AKLATLLDTRQVAELRRCTPNAIVQAVRRGQGPPVYGRGARGLLLFRAEDVDAWIRGETDGEAQGEAEQVSGGDGARGRPLPDPSRDGGPEDGAEARDRPRDRSGQSRGRSESPRERARRMAQRAHAKRRGRTPAAR